MFYHHNINPVVVALGPVQVHWYGIMYVVSFLMCMRVLKKLIALQGKQAIWTYEHIQGFIVWIMIGIILGGRIGYVLFYDFAAFIQNPLMLFAINKGGMSFHGGFLGVVVTTLLYCKKHHFHPFDIGDQIAIVSPIGLFFGRIGNFINGELWGAPTTLPWAVVFDKTGGGPMPRHPSMLYEALFEGLLLFILLFWLGRNKRPRFFLTAIFLIGYAAARFAIEFIRTPDAHLGYLAFNWLTMGQLLTIPMGIVGAWLLWYSKKTSTYAPAWKSRKA